MRQSLLNDKGFTFLEVSIVITILLLLAATAVPIFSQTVYMVEKRTTERQLKTIFNHASITAKSMIKPVDLICIENEMYFYVPDINSTELDKKTELKKRMFFAQTLSTYPSGSSLGNDSEGNPQIVQYSEEGIPSFGAGIEKLQIIVRYKETQQWIFELSKENKITWIE